MKNVQAKSLSHNKEPVSLWDSAISDAEKMLNEAKSRVSNLKRTITLLKGLRDRGEPLPVEKSEQTEAGT